MRRSKLVLYFLILISTAKLYSIPDTALLHLYTRYAVTAFEDGRIEDALGYADSADEYGAALSDTYYIRAKAALDSGLLLEGLHLLLQARDTGDWLLIEPEVCLEEVIPRAFQLGDYASLIEVVDTAPLRFLQEESTAFLYLQARIRSDRTENLGSLFDAILHYHPFSTRIIFLERLFSGNNELFKQRLSGDPARYPRISDTEAEALFSFPGEALSAELLAPYMSIGEFLTGMLAEGRVLSADYLDLLRNPPSRLDQGEIYALLALENPFIRSALIDVLNRYSGQISMDRNRDDYPEAVLELENGMPMQLRFDGNQDGESEWKIVFMEGRPDEVILFEDEANIRLMYRDYPKLDRVVAERAEYRERYLLLPGHENHPLENAGIPVGRLGELIAGDSPPLEITSSLPLPPLRNSLHRIEILKGEMVESEWLFVGQRTAFFRSSTLLARLEDGQLSRLVSDYDLDGFFEILEVRSEEGSLFYYSDSGYTLDSVPEGIGESGTSSDIPLPLLLR